MEPTDKANHKAYDNEWDTLLVKPGLHVPADFAKRVMHRVDAAPSPFAVSAVHQAPANARRAPWRNRLQSLSKRRIGILSLPQLLAFVFGIMLATAAG
jgi:negative regulator of sigma E activity